MTIAEIIPVLVGLIGGFAGKKIGNHEATGPQPWGKILGPLGAAAGAIAITAILGVDLDVQAIFAQGGESGATAIMIHTVLKNVWQLVAGLLKAKT